VEGGDEAVGEREEGIDADTRGEGTWRSGDLKMGIMSISYVGRV
jgi:hypothetical protein